MNSGDTVLQNLFAKRSTLLSIPVRLALIVALLVGLLPMTPTAPTLVSADTSSSARHSPGALEHDVSGRALPAGLSESEWGDIQEQIRRAEYHLTWYETSAAYTAPNRVHGWHTAFSATGVQVTPRISPELAEGWSWGLSLTGYGYEGKLQTIAGRPAPTVDANRVEFHHDANLTEWYVNDASGLEQGFTLAAPPTSHIPHPTSPSKWLSTPPSPLAWLTMGRRSSSAMRTLRQAQDKGARPSCATANFTPTTPPTTRYRPA